MSWLMESSHLIAQSQTQHTDKALNTNNLLKIFSRKKEKTFQMSYISSNQNSILKLLKTMMLGPPHKKLQIYAFKDYLKTLDTIGNCQRSVSPLVYLNICIKQPNCENVSLIGRPSCEITMKEKNTLVTPSHVLSDA